MFNGNNNPLYVRRIIYYITNVILMITFINITEIGLSWEDININYHSAPPFTSKSRRWDVNGDNIVNITDLVLIGRDFGKTYNENDVNKDGNIDISDLVLVGIHFGEQYEEQNYLPGVNILDYGAVGGNIADDVTAIQSAVNVVEANGGGTVYIPAGTYRIETTITIDSDKVQVLGAGKSSIIHAVGGIDAFYVQGSGAGDLLEDIEISNLKIKGEYAAESSGRGIRADYVSRLNVNNCFVEDCAEGIQIGLSSVAQHCSIVGNITKDCYIGIRLDDNSQYNEVTKNIVLNSIYDGIYLCGAADVRYNVVQGNIVVGNDRGITMATNSNHNSIIGNYVRVETGTQAAIADSSGAMGGYHIINDNIITAGYLSIDSPYTALKNNLLHGSYCILFVQATADYSTVEGNYSSGNTNNAGAVRVYGDSCQFKGNYIIGNRYHGVFFQNSSGHQIVENYCINNGKVIAGSGIALINTDNCFIDGNYCTDDQTPKTQTYGIEIDADSTGNRLGTNYVEGNKNGGISDAGNNVIRVFTNGDTTPSVAGNDKFSTYNSAATTITFFDDGEVGQEITIVFGDNNTTIQASENLKLQGGINFTGTQFDMITLMYDGTNWIEIGRSVNG